MIKLWVMFPMGLDRSGLSKTFTEAGYETTFCDWMFALGVPIPIHSLRTLKGVAATFVPILSRLPFEMLYPSGEKQDTREPKYEKWYQLATVVAGDCHYTKKHMPDNMQGKVIVTNTTTPEDVALFKKCGVKYLVTIHPRPGRPLIRHEHDGSRSGGCCREGTGVDLG